MSLQSLKNTDLAAAATQILSGARHQYEFQTRGIGNPVELLVAELERLSTGNSRAKARRKFLTDAIDVFGTDLCKKIEIGRPLQTEHVHRWCLTASLSRDPIFSRTSQDLYAACRKVKTLVEQDLNSAVVAVTSTFNKPEDGLVFWESYLEDNFAPHYAIYYFIEHQPENPAIPASISRLFAGVLYNFIDVEVEALLDDYIDALYPHQGSSEIQAQNDVARLGIVSDVFKRIPSKLYDLLRIRLKQKPLFAAWARILPDTVQADVQARVVEASSQLANLGISTEVLLNTSLHPEEINTAIAAFMGLDGEQYLKVAGTEKIAMVDFMYPMMIDTAELERKHSDFFARFDDLSKKEQSLGRLERNGIEFDISDLTSRTAERMRVILQVAFFFATPSRYKEGWGVLPLGTHKAFGVLIPKETLAGLFVGEFDVDRINEVYGGDKAEDRISEALLEFADDFSSLPIIGADWSSEASKIFFAQLIDSMSRNRAKREPNVQVLEGFVMDDLAASMLLDQSSIRNLSFFQEHLTMVDEDDESHLSLLPKWQENYRRRKPPEVSSGIALFDLGRMGVVAKSILGHDEFQSDSGPCTNDYVIATLRHGQNVPVGIGYSLPMLPSLLLKKSSPGRAKDKFFYELVMEWANEIYLDSKNPNSSIVKDYRKIGIDIFDRFGPKPSLRIVPDKIIQIDTTVSSENKIASGE